jgi:predicted ABC-type ATPase
VTDAIGRIYVLAGVNGSGKSSIGGVQLRAAGARYINPDEVAARLHAGDPTSPLATAQIDAWQMSTERLERAIDERTDYNFETTLGGNTIPALLARALDAGLEVRMWFVGLDSVERHLARVRARVARGGHDIPDDKIRARYVSSIAAAARLAPRLTELWVHDNSIEADPHDGRAPRPRLLLHARAGAVLAIVDDAPAWARPILAAVATPAPA